MAGFPTRQRSRSRMWGPCQAPTAANSTGAGTGVSMTLTPPNSRRWRLGTTQVTRTPRPMSSRLPRPMAASRIGTTRRASTSLTARSRRWTPGVFTLTSTRSCTWGRRLRTRTHTANRITGLAMVKPPVASDASGQEVGLGERKAATSRPGATARAMPAQFSPQARSKAQP